MNTLYDWFKEQIEYVQTRYPDTDDFTLYYLGYEDKRLAVMRINYSALKTSNLKFRKKESILPRTK